MLVIYSVQFCWCWGEEGHKIIANIAANMLNPTASGIVDEFTGPDYTIVDIAPWPDEYAHSPQVRKIFPGLFPINLS